LKFLFSNLNNEPGGEGNSVNQFKNLLIEYNNMLIEEQENLTILVKDKISHLFSVGKIHLIELFLMLKSFTEEKATNIIGSIILSFCLKIWKVS
jgi:hypothetical protein